jgi:hypothetical protein
VTAKSVKYLGKLASKLADQVRREGGEERREGSKERLFLQVHVQRGREGEEEEEEEEEEEGDKVEPHNPPPTNK